MKIKNLVFSKIYLLIGEKNIQFIRGRDNRKKWDTYQPLELVEQITGEKYGL